MDDILIVSSQQSQAAALWVNYLKVCFSQINKSRKKPPFKIMCVYLEDVVGPQVVPHAIEAKMMGVKLQIVILCPQFLHHIYENPGPAMTLGRLLQPDRVLAMLLGVEESAVTEQHRAALISYPQWQHIPVKDQDQTCVSKFLQEALDIMTRVWRQQTLRTEKALFSVMPKKVKEDQNKVIVLLNESIEKEDKLKITVDKNGELLEVSSIKRRNPFTLHFQMPESCLEVSMLVSVHVEKNGQALGYRQVKCESRMRELDQILRSCDNPLEFMCQTLGFSPGDREYLDNFLVLAFQRNLPPHFNLLHISGPPHHHRTCTSPEEYPTLLHFAARYGLEKFAWQLLECPGGEYACEIRNACELTPAEMAEAAGHSKLANILRGYMQMTEFTSMYSYMKIMSEGKAKSTGFNETEYHQPRPLSQTYQIPPAARGLMDNYQVPPTARPYFPPKNEMGYMEMHPPAALSKPVASSFTHSLEYLDTVAANSETPATCIRSPSPVRTSPKSDTLDQLGLEEEKLSISDSAKKVPEQYSAQDELVEILNDFKNNVFSIAEIETLVQHWQKRNDVQQSFKDKQEQLNQMREEYERLQQRMTESMKRPTPFERIRSLFKGKPRETKESSHRPSGSCQGDGIKTNGSESLPVCQRPSSSLSLHSISSSTSSSGRMSTASACSAASLGDSGTHSDLEDRKTCPSSFDARNLSNDAKFGIQSYEVPPPPRPLQRPSCSPQYTPASLQQQMTPSPAYSPPNNSSIENRPPWPSPRPDLEFESSSSNFANSEDSNSFTKTTMILQSPTSKRRLHRNTNGGEQHTLGDSGDCEYLELQDSPPGDSSLTDYVNLPGVASLKVSIAETVTSVNSEEGSSQTKLDTSGTVSPTPSDSSELPDYVNVQVSSSEPCLPPPIPPRKK